MHDVNSLKPLNTAEYLDELLADGFVVKGPRDDPERDAGLLRKQLEKGREFTPETWFPENGYKFVEPSTFTQGYRIAYKIIDDFPDERYNSQYSLAKDGRQIPLYLKMDAPGR